MFVARNQAGEAGKLNVSEGRVEAIWCHHGRQSTKGDVLVVECVSSELVVEVLRAEDLQGVEFRPGHFLRQAARRVSGRGQLAPYVKVRFLGSKFTTGYRHGGGGTFQFKERGLFAVPTDAGLDAPSMLFKVKDKRHIGMDALIGEGSLSGSALANQ